MRPNNQTLFELEHKNQNGVKEAHTATPKQVIKKLDASLTKIFMKQLPPDLLRDSFEPNSSERRAYCSDTDRKIKIYLSRKKLERIELILKRNRVQETGITNGNTDGNRNEDKTPNGKRALSPEIVNELNLLYDNLTFSLEALEAKTAGKKFGAELFLFMTKLLDWIDRLGDIPEQIIRVLKKIW